MQHVSSIPGLRHLSDQPVHARQVAPEVARTVGSGHLLGIDHHRVALIRGRAGLSRALIPWLQHCHLVAFHM